MSGGGPRSPSIKENAEAVKRRIELAAERAGRDPSGIKLVAVSKKKPAEDILEAYGAGLTAFGENYVQELAEKMGSDVLRGLPGPGIEWHMIGHVQTNKVKNLIGKTALIHSLDSLRLAGEIQKQSERAGVTTDVLMEINVAREASKYGFFLEEAQKAAEEISQYGNVRICGIMASAPAVGSPEQNRPYFNALNEFFLDMSRKRIHNTRMRVLSIGMSGDFEAAIEAGSTMVRIGTLLFGRRQ